MEYLFGNRVLVLQDDRTESGRLYIPPKNLTNDPHRGVQHFFSGVVKMIGEDVKNKKILIESRVIFLGIPGNYITGIEHGGESCVMIREPDIFGIPSIPSK